MEAAVSNLQTWSERLSERSLPAFAQTAAQIINRSNDVESSAAELARCVLQDMSMTARLLRMANSSYFAPPGTRINTVSRAIVMLGFDTVRDLSLSIAVIDSLWVGPHRDQVANAMATAFHSAMQAQKLAQLSHHPSAEEVYIATLLSHLGEMAVMCFLDDIGDAQRQRLLDTLGRPPAERESVERDVLGFALRDLTAVLNKDWRLSSALTQALDRSSPMNTASSLIGHGNSLAYLLRHKGEGPELNTLINEISKSLHISSRDLHSAVWQVAQQTADTLRALGAPAVADLVPHTPATPRSPTADSAAQAEVADQAAAVPNTKPAAPSTLWPQGDAHLQLAIIRDLSQTLLEGKPSAITLMEVVLEGVFRGVGMDRVVFALLTPDRSQLRARSSLIADGANFSPPFEFSIRDGETYGFSAWLKQTEPAWLQGELPPVPASKTMRALNGGHCFFAPLWVGSTAIGGLYADRAPSGRPLDAELFQQFKMFAQQARMGLGFIKQRAVIRDS
ncbi:HDOD domain-containing protein [Pseudomarimonas arenosa]|uniref:HDOD domain-containing protein n=1 Tax=Pseudomarimonas arenosa TaxID=2774145 RepID=A0AAW3ZM25_9GAMM|nr:HDOD domain-containing protein [Pseudomarimonas arenosa]MBD8527208.1 HDOD domain-containing protein [Pseudomarimonas arenosa]